MDQQPHEQQARDLHWMGVALDLARAAAEQGEIPVGAIVVQDAPGQPAGGRIIGQGFNRREAECDPSAHAEIVAMRQAGQALGEWRMLGCTMYVTLEPCPMCAGALVNARLPRLVYGCADPKAGAVKTLYELCTDRRLNHCVEVIGGIRADEAAEILRAFFRLRRTGDPNQAPSQKGPSEAKKPREDGPEPIAGPGQIG